MRHSNGDARRLAAAVLGNRASSDARVLPALVDAYAYNADAESVPWDGGPLYVPRANFSQEQARTLLGHLIAWQVHCRDHELQSELRQVVNNLASVNLQGQAGMYGLGWDPDQNLRVWQQATGTELTPKH